MHTAPVDRERRALYRVPRTPPNTPRPTPTTRLLQRLADLQESSRLSDRAFARKLGITNGHWSRVRAGTASMGRKTLQAVTRTFPQLEPDVLAYIRDRGSANTDEP